MRSTEIATKTALCLAIALLAAGCAAAPAPSREPAAYATVKDCYESFRSAIAHDDYDAAYEALSGRTRERYPQRLFWIAFNMTATGQKYRLLLANSDLVTHIEKKDGASAVAVLRSKDPESGGWVMRSFRLVKAQEQWRVEFTLQEFFGIPEEQFFDFDQVAEKRDFRHRR